MQNTFKFINLSALSMVFILATSNLLLAPATADEVSALSNAVSGAYKVDHTHASVTWKVMHKGLSRYTARFTDIEADLQFDAQNPENSTLKVSIDPRSVRTDYPQGKSYKFAKDVDFDGELAGKNWFHADSFPTIEFTATGITRTADNTGHVTGQLDFLGVHKPLTLDVTLNGAKSNHDKNTGALGFSATTTLNRSDFGLSRYVPMIADQVDVLIEIEFYLDHAE